MLGGLWWLCCRSKRLGRLISGVSNLGAFGKEKVGCSFLSKRLGIWAFPNRGEVAPNLFLWVGNTPNVGLLPPTRFEIPLAGLVRESKGEVLEGFNPPSCSFPFPIQGICGAATDSLSLSVSWPTFDEATDSWSGPVEAICSCLSSILGDETTSESAGKATKSSSAGEGSGKGEATTSVSWICWDEAIGSDLKF